MERGEATNVEQLERLASELAEAERVRHRRGELNERLLCHRDDRTELERGQDHARRELGSLRFGWRRLWHALQGSRAERVQRVNATLDRLADRIRIADELSAALSDELAELDARAAQLTPLEKARAALDIEAKARRMRWQREAPELAAQLSAIEAQLPEARNAHAEAASQLATAREASHLLADARADLTAVLDRAPANVSGWFESSLIKPRYLEDAITKLRKVSRVLPQLHILNDVRDELVPPEAGLKVPPQRMNGDASTSVQYLENSEYTLEGVVEAQKLFAEIVPTLERDVRAARNHENALEHRRAALLLGSTSPNAATPKRTGGD